MGNYADSFGLQWNIHAKTQLDSYTGVQVSRQRLFDSTGWPTSMYGEHVLEAGSGAGRFTEVLLQTGAEVYSFDYSDAVIANASNNGHHPNVRLFRAGIYDIPFPEGTFDKVLCLGVLQHTPDPELAFKSLVRQLKPGGMIVIDCYAKKLTNLVHWKYLLRPLTKRMNKQLLYKIVSFMAPKLLPIALFMLRHFGKAGSRLIPVAQHAAFGLPLEIQVEWAVLDTFDWLSPEYDKPQGVKTIRRWFEDVGLTDIRVERGWNGFVGRGKRPQPATVGV